MPGPLLGCRVIELAGRGTVPFAAMMLADMGADVVCIDRTERAASSVEVDVRHDVVRRSRRSVALDLKHPAGRDALLTMVERADILIEGFRPGVMERLGVGPKECHDRNPRLVYGRVTGWGQDGPLATTAGHDLNYLALAGALGQLRRPGEPPLPSLNLLGDVGGGAMFLAFGVVCALWEVQRSGLGQVVDAAIVDGVAAMMAGHWGLRTDPAAYDADNPGSNAFDMGSHFYNVYECADGGYVAVGAYEPPFYASLLAALGISDDENLAVEFDRSRWPEQRRRLEQLFRQRTRAEWTDLFDGTDGCVTPVLSMSEAAAHEHHRAREVFVDVDGITQPAPTPRYSRTKTVTPAPPVAPGTHTRDALSDLGLTGEQIDELFRSGAAYQEEST